MEGLQGKTAIVTGGSSGIGQAIAVRLGHEGVNVAVNYVGAMEGAVATSEAIEAGVHACISEINECRAPSRALLVEADVSDEDAVERMFKEVRGEFGTRRLPHQQRRHPDRPGLRPARRRRLRPRAGRQPARRVPVRPASRSASCSTTSGRARSSTSRRSTS